MEKITLSDVRTIARDVAQLPGVTARVADLPDSTVALALPATRTVVFRDDRMPVGLAVHELSHLLADIDDRPPNDLEMCQAKYPYTAAALSEIAGEVCNVPDWSRHEADWIRAAVHLSWRTCQAGYWHHLEDVRIAGDGGYVDSPAWMYLAELAPELRSEQPLPELLATEPPAGFPQLWKLDTET